MIIFFYLITMLFYIKVKRKLPYHRFLTEGIFLVVVGALVFLVRMWLIDYPAFVASNAIENVGYWGSKVAYVIYTIFGSFQFEGLPQTYLNMSFWKIYLYYGSAVYSGLILLTLIASSFSYEIYSWLNINFRRFSKKDTYIFTALNEYTLIFAKSIVDEFSNKKDYKYEIIFSGNHLKPFDRHDSLCVEVVKNGFLYYSQRKKEDVSLLKILKVLKKYNDRNPNVFDRKIYMFAFGFDKDEYYADEVNNSGTVFQEIENVLNLIINKKKNYFSQIIDFYILTKEDLNYKSYTEKKNEVIKKIVDRKPSENKSLNKDKKILKHYFEIIGEQIKKVLALNKEKPLNYYKEIAKFFQVHIVNESNLTAKLFSSKRHKVFDEKELIRDILREDNSYHALFLGFGNTNKKILSQLYIDTAVVDKDYQESLFCATIVDKDLKDRIGVYAGEHPSFIVLEHEGDEIFNNDIRKILNNPENEPRKTYDRQRLKAINKYFDGKLETVKFPLITYKEASCTSIEFLKLLDTNLGADGTLHSYNTIVIALGNDEENIKLANVVINDAKKELAREKDVKKERKPQLIAVHIKDKNNNFKLEKVSKAVDELKVLKIVSFGSKDEVYNYKNIIDDGKAKMVNASYGWVYDHIYKIPKESNAIASDFDNNYKLLMKADSNIKKAVLETLKYLYSKVMSIQDKEYNWLGLTEAKKESNRQAVMYTPVIMAIMNDERINNDIKWLSACEHIRWNRYHFSTGWTYNKARDDQQREHDSLTDLDLIPGFKNMFDMINIALLYNINKSETNND
ncbi:MAG: hypothetical protein PHX62_04440 [Bacilli bacterium]|nr:hypothetical protein [Bacilli bacterium]